MPTNRHIQFIGAAYRVPAAMLLGLSLGILAGFWFARGHDRWLTFHTAGAIGLFAGFWAGLGWHLKIRAPERPYAMMIILGLAAHLLAYSAYLNLAVHVNSSEALDRLRSLEPARITRIFILRQHQADPIAIIEKRSSIQEFARACRAVRPFVPMPDYEPRIIFSCDVDLGAAFPYLLSIHYFHNEDDVLIGLFAVRQGESTVYRGAFVSRELRTWFDTHLDLS